MRDRHALDAAGKVGRPRDEIGVAGVHPPDDLNFLRGEILIPAKLFEHGEREFRIAILDLGPGRVRPLGEKVVVVLLLELLSVFDPLTLDDALYPKASAECAAAFAHRKGG